MPTTTIEGISIRQLAINGVWSKLVESFAKGNQEYAEGLNRVLTRLEKMTDQEFEAYD